MASAKQQRTSGANDLASQIAQSKQQQAAQLVTARQQMGKTSPAASRVSSNMARNAAPQPVTPPAPRTGPQPPTMSGARYKKGGSVKGWGIASGARKAKIV